MSAAIQFSESREVKRKGEKHSYEKNNEHGMCMVIMCEGHNAIEQLWINH